jgi:hypothetical protein
LFTQPIAFIVGAGASCEYGLPVGATLLTKIMSTVLLDRVHPDNLGFMNVFAERLDFYTKAGKELAEFIKSGVPSIDDALTWFSSRAEVVELGKAAIALEILKAEKSSVLCDNFSDIVNSPKAINTWIPHFLSMVMTGHKNEDAEKAFKNVSIINFNYDRTIEHFLYGALQHNFGLKERRAKDIVNGIKMFRPYGKVGPLRWQSEPELGLGFGEITDRRRLISASKNILTFSEGVTKLDFGQFTRRRRAHLSCAPR